MFSCLIGVVIVAIFLVIILIVVERVLAAFGWGDPTLLMLIRLLVGLIVLLYALQCLFGVGPPFPPFLGRQHLVS